MSPATEDRDDQAQAEENPIRDNPFESISNELLIMVATLLSPLDRASLAFTSRHTHALLQNALSLNPHSDRYNFLSRLENSGIWPEEILCAGCKKFHLPRKRRQWTQKEGSRDCIRNGSMFLLGYLETPYLQYQVHFDLVAAIMRSHRHNSGVYSVNLLASHQVHANERVKIVSTTSARVHQGQLLLKTETFVFCGKAAEALWNIALARKMLSSIESLWQVCQHLNWDQPWRFVFYPFFHFLHESKGVPQYREDTGTFVSRYDQNMSALHKCLWTHPSNCWIRCQAASRVETSLDMPWSCKGCTTDYKVSVGYLEREGMSSLGKYVVFTSWKNLGEGHDVTDKRWLGHMNLPSNGMLTTGFLDAARAFEGMAEGAKFEYCPSFPSGTGQDGIVSIP